MRGSSPVIASRQLVHAVTGNLPKADGVCGRRHYSRGMFGFWNPPRRMAKTLTKTMTEPAIDIPSNAFIGFRIIKHS